VDVIEKTREHPPVADAGTVRNWVLLGLVSVAALPLLHEAAGAVGVVGLLSIASLAAMWLLLRPQRRDIAQLAAEPHGVEASETP
jgi:cbb3-type cytochrome oxidase subunit 3